jgi:hypothetical protein
MSHSSEGSLRARSSRDLPVELLEKLEGIDSQGLGDLLQFDDIEPSFTAFIF